MKSILLVDDNADTRAVLCAMLTDEGYAVLEASNGKQALDLLVSESHEEPCLIVLDLGMPVMSGREFLAIASNYSRLARVPVLVTSGSHEHPGALDHDAVIGYLPKPFDFETLLATVRRVAERDAGSEAALVHARKAATA
jgi:two-component system KDP operon response regulator KdpE